MPIRPLLLSHHAFSLYRPSNATKLVTVIWNETDTFFPPSSARFVSPSVRWLVVVDRTHCVALCPQRGRPTGHFQPNWAVFGRRCPLPLYAARLGRPMNASNRALPYWAAWGTVASSLFGSPFPYGDSVDFLDQQLVARHFLPVQLYRTYDWINQILRPGNGSELGKESQGAREDERGATEKGW